MKELTITGYRIAYPEDYWAAMKERYPNKSERVRAQEEGRDHLGRYGLLSDYRCYRCGFLCED